MPVAPSAPAPPASSPLRIETRRDVGRRIDHDRLERLERDIHDMRKLILESFQRKSDG